jgi:NADH-quinone oxidoreductase subunit C
MCHNLSVRLFLRQFTNSVLGLSSLVDLYRSAGWLEREMFDLFGIFFFGNSDLRRILTDYGFMGFPLRKDFPLSGFFEVRYDDLVKQIILEPLQLSQEFRFYTYDLPWRKIDYV